MEAAWLCFRHSCSIKQQTSFAREHRSQSSLSRRETTPTEASSSPRASDGCATPNPQCMNSVRASLVRTSQKKNRPKRTFLISRRFSVQRGREYSLICSLCRRRGRFCIFDERRWSQGAFENWSNGSKRHLRNAINQNVRLKSSMFWLLWSQQSRGPTWWKQWRESVPRRISISPHSCSFDGYFQKRFHSLA